MIEQLVKSEIRHDDKRTSHRFRDVVGFVVGFNRSNTEKKNRNNYTKHTLSSASLRLICHDLRVQWTDKTMQCWYFLKMQKSCNEGEQCKTNQYLRVLKWVLATTVSNHLSLLKVLIVFIVVFLRKQNIPLRIKRICHFHFAHL